MATMTSAVSGTNVVYTITDMQSNTMTVTAPPPGGKVTVSGGVLNDGLWELARLLNLLAANGTSPRPQVLANTGDSLYS